MSNSLVKWIFVSALGCGAAMFYGLANAEDHMPNQSCFSAIHLEPAFIAFNAEKESQLGNWYKDLFGLETAKEFTTPNGRASGTLMYKDEFIVEVFYPNDALKKEQYVPDAPLSQWTGIMKFGVYTNADLPTLKQCLVEKGINAGRIFKDPLLNIDLLLVTDPNRNIIEIIKRGSESKSSD